MTLCGIDLETDYSQYQKLTTKLLQSHQWGHSFDEK
jgi:hypothetical protein